MGRESHMIVKKQIRQLEKEIQELKEKIRATEHDFGLGHEDVVSDYKQMLKERQVLLTELKLHRRSA
jgi:hypothetical protein